MRYPISVTLLVVSLTHARGWAQEQPTLSGSWSASPMHVQWNIGQWGAACGPRPSGSGSGSGAGTVTVQQGGNELSISGLGRDWSTTECWEQYPGLARRSHSAGARGWRNVCKTADSDPRQATVVTTLSATDTTMSFDETGQYQFIIKGQNCTASVRRTRTFSLIERQGEARQEKPTKSQVPTPLEPQASRPKPVSGACAERGPPARLEVRPARKLMRAGESFTFRTRVLDAKGCPLGHEPAWQILEGESVAVLNGPGQVDVKPEAGEAEVKLSASVRGQSVEVAIEVVPRDRYEALLSQRGFNAEGESADAAAAAIAGGSVGAKSAVSRAGGTSRTTFVAIVGGLALLVGVVGLLLVQRRRKQGTEGRGPHEPSVLPTAGGSTTTRLSKRCPSCGRGFTGDEQFCTEDATVLVTVDSAMAQAAPPAIDKICPICGAQYPAVAQFCGKDGATLVPVN